MKQIPVETMSKSDQRAMREWAQEHGKVVRQLTIRQTNTKHSAGTLPLNMYRKELPVGERILIELVVLENCADGRIEPTVSCDQQSEYDSASDEVDHPQAEDQEEASDVELHEEPVTPGNFLIVQNNTHSIREDCHFVTQSPFIVLR